MKINKCGGLIVVSRAQKSRFIKWFESKLGKVNYSKDKIIHCNYKDDGISVTEIKGRVGGPPIYWYKLK